MLIIGCDFHTRYQQIAMVDEATGEMIERRLDHESGEAHAFYRDLQGPVRVGIEATGPIRWFERLLAELAGGSAFELSGGGWQALYEVDSAALGFEFRATFRPKSANN